jgi:hypothetical protein
LPNRPQELRKNSISRPIFVFEEKTDPSNSGRKSILRESRKITQKVLNRAAVNGKIARLLSGREEAPDGTGKNHAGWFF